MYITEILTKTKKGEISHRCFLLRQSYRENGNVKTRTILNLKNFSKEEIDAMRLALKYKGDLSVLKSSRDFIKFIQGLSFGAIWLVYDIARKLGIEKALGTDKNGKRALWQVIARVLEQGSRLSAVRLAGTHALVDVLGITKGFSEDQLYENLTWLSKNQENIENRLFNFRYKGKKPELFLYDVTSSYFEGTQNELSAWGYNRDGKSGKMQVVAGLLCDEDGQPISIELFPGNTSDLSTFKNQIQKASDRYNCDRVTFVGDRGMIKSTQISQLKGAGFNYITAITKAQIEKLVKDEVFQMCLFTEEILEVEDDGVRYILRRNPIRRDEIVNNRNLKIESINNLCQKKNNYLQEHLRAKPEVAKKGILKKIEKLKLSNWLDINISDRKLELTIDKDQLLEDTKFDGCYVIKTDLPIDIKKETIHNRYKDLAKVEKAFRYCKTSFLEMRPWFVRKEENTRGHAFVVFLSYLIVQYLQKAWYSIDITVEEGLVQLATLSVSKVILKNGNSFNTIPVPNKSLKKLLDTADVKMPGTIQNLDTIVGSRVKLQNRRKVNK